MIGDCLLGKDGTIEKITVFDGKRVIVALLDCTDIECMLD